MMDQQLDSNDIDKNVLYRFYTIVNIVFFLGAVTAYLTINSLFNWGAGNISANTLSTPLYTSDVFFGTCWGVLFSLMFLFVLRGVIKGQSSTHYMNCVNLKIKLWFCLFCLFFVGTQLN